MQRKFNFPDRQSFSRMTNVDAQEILCYVTELEFPKIVLTSLQFALFKVCAPAEHGLNLTADG